MDEVEIRIVREPIGAEALLPLADAWHKTAIKGVADIEREVIALGGEWHMDANTMLIADGSSQKDVWGFNIYPEEKGNKAIAYVSLINIRPAQGNRDMEVESEDIKSRMRSVVARLIPSLDL